MYLLCLAGPKSVPEQLHSCRGVHKPAIRAHHQGKEASQLLHERYVSPLLHIKTKTYGGVKYTVTVLLTKTTNK